MHAEREFLRRGPEGDLGEDLVAEGAGHDEGRVTSGTAGLELANQQVLWQLTRALTPS